uniref:Retrotransposon protein, putative, unclassified n=2 Tax=Oryza sativa subsp. japonica TaxID=39947 RepID=Q8H7Z7_ORYSJ|nr:putative gypsy-type retrotransposon RIRE2 protein [Oryza sativa Japonica Group]AAP52609.1 retrotransposon protein, putative, unclassified [Oryza sativa Japonica Group]
MVAHGVLPAKEIIGWRLAFGEAFPTPNTHEVVVFSHFFYGGFSLPTSRFFRGILDFYGISLHHLNPNSIVHIANFIHTCEAFLGIRPHFALFRRIFFLKPQPNKSKPSVVGGAGFQLRGTLSQKYFSMPFKTSNKGWHANWFYVQNPEPALPEYSYLPPVYQDTWNSLPMGEEAVQAVTLMDRMLKLKEQGLQGEQITRHFIKSRLAPIKERSRTAFEFDGKHDPNREDPKSLEFKVMKERMYKIFSNAIVVSYSHLLPVVPYNAFNPPPPLESSYPGIRLDEIRPSNYPTPITSPVDRKPSDIDPTGKDSEPTDMETGPSKETGPTAEDHPSDNQPATDNEPPTGNQSGVEPNRDVPKVETQTDSPPKKDTSNDPVSSSPIKGIVINKQKEDEEVCLLKKALSQATRIVNRIHLRNEAKTATLERLVPHLGTLEATRNQLHEARELARKTEHDLRDRIAELQDSNFELSGSSKDRKIKSQAQFDVLVNKIKRLEGARDEVANATTPLVQAMFFNNNGPSTFDASKIFDKLRVAPDTYFKNIKEAGSMGASLVLAMTKSLYPKIDIDAIDGFADGTSEEVALDLINEA